MHILMIRLLTYSLLAFVLLSCKSKRLPSQEYAVHFREEVAYRVIENPYFSQKNEYLYRASITAYGRSFNGIFATKKISENEQRVALTTDFGNTLFDFSFIDNKLKINYIQDDLNRKIIIKTLANDFQNLLQKEFVCDLTHVNENSTKWISKNEKGKIYLYENKEQVIYKQINYKKSKKYTTFAFTADENKNAKNIDIQHHTLDIRIILNQM